MKHIQDTIAQLRRYIAANESGDDLDGVDCLLAVALDEIRQKLAEKPESRPQDREGGTSLRRAG